MNPSSCDRAREWMSDWLAGDLSMDEQASLEAHLSGCDSCRTVLDRLLLQDRALGEMVGASLSAALEARVRQALASGAASRRGRIRR
ncbi:MAG TPA: zf-HC2 domain-containing protein, partial [Planctomycetota bacterium]|nr:zf-HC2 domain-containing protein [Planctomycetota bacterium]